MVVANAHVNKHVGREDEHRNISNSEQHVVVGQW